MTVSTINYSLSAKDGWTSVATNPTFIHVRSNHNSPWYVYVSPTAPVLVGAQATGTINLTGLPVAAETVTVNGQVYTWRAAVGVTANEVKIGADATASASNLADAINATAANAGTTFGSATVQNTGVSASPAAGVVTVQSRLAGTAGNAITLTEASSNLTVSGATLSGGSDASVGMKISENYGDYRDNFEHTGSLTAQVYIRTLSAYPVNFSVIRDQ